MLDEHYPDLDLWDPDEFEANFGGTLADWNQLYPRLVDAIRKVDSDTPILIGGNGYSHAEWLPLVEPVDDARIVYTVHQYQPFDYTHQDTSDDLRYPSSTDGLDRAHLEEIIEPADDFASAHGVPVASNEMGGVRYAPGIDRFVSDELDLFEARGWNHAIWMHYPAEGHPGGDWFDYLMGPDPDNHESDESNAFLRVLRRFWDRNTLRPSNVEFEG